MATSLEIARVSRILLGNIFSRTSQIASVASAKCLSQASSATSSSASQIQVVDGSDPKAKKISLAMKAYLERAQKYDSLMKDETAEYEIGKRHLAHIMGEDPNTFSQEDVDRAIEYLLPSGLFDKRARPVMKHPSQVIPKRKDAQFDSDGRPFHHLFYTGLPNYYQLMHDIAVKIEDLRRFENLMADKGKFPSKDRKLILTGSVWIKKEVLESRLNEKLSDNQYVRFTNLMERLSIQGFALQEKDFVFSYRKELEAAKLMEILPPLTEDPITGRRYSEAQGSRKKSHATVKVWEKGSGQFSVNGRDVLTEFPRINDREQLLFPLQFTGLIREVDVEASVEGVGDSARSGAIRYATSLALQNFVDSTTRESMRLAGLLTRDPRVRERKKPGQEGARRKFTWKKR